jgi:hypothetical protein
MPCLNIYRKGGAARFDVDISRETLFISLAKAIDPSVTFARKGEKKYKWESRVTIALNVHEAAMFGAFARRAIVGQQDEKISVLHTPAGAKEGPMKTLSLRRADKNFVLSIKSGDDEITIPLGYSDLYLIDSLISSQIPQMLPKSRAEIPEIKEEVREEEEEEIPF